MKKVILLLIFLLSIVAGAQNEQLAQNYFDKGEFDKAKISYEELLAQQPTNTTYFNRLVDTYQQLKQFDLAEKAILQRLDKYKQAMLLVELGYNYQLKQEQFKADKYYEDALDRIRKNPQDVYGVAPTFERKSLLQYALESYKIAVGLDARYTFNFQMAMLYGQMGNTEMMINMFLDEAFRNPQSSIMIQNQLSRFMMGEEGESTFNESLKKALLVRAQQNQDVFWNEYLSWFFVQLKEYGKAFVQQKAIYKRSGENFSNIVNLADLAIDEKDAETAKEILQFVIENTQDIETLVQAHNYLMEIRIDGASEKDFVAIGAELNALIQQFGVSSYTLPLQIQQAGFVTFSLSQPEVGKAILNDALELQLSKYQQADVKMQLADIFLFEEKFNQALLYYSQIEDDLKNDAVGHQASLKAAKTTYFKADFKWASAQFKTLKSASSQLIANDALEYFLLISDNTVADSTQMALKQFARGDYLLYQNKNQQALSQFQSILKSFKGDEIEAVTLLRLGETFEKLKQYQDAILQYQTILDAHKESIYVDEALYYSAEIYRVILKDSDKAKSLYEQILFNHQDSIYFVNSRLKFRQLRGDTNL